MKADLLGAVAQEIEAKERFARFNPLRFPGDPQEIDAILDIALRDPGAGPGQILESYLAAYGRRPKVRIASLLRRHRIARRDGREECLSDAEWLRPALQLLLAAEDAQPAAAAYHTLQAWLTGRKRLSGPIVARLALASLAGWLRDGRQPAACRELGERLSTVEGLIKPVTSLDLLRRIVYRAAEVRELRERATLTDRVDELISSLDDATEGAPAERDDLEYLQEENADLRAALFGFKNELTELKARIKELTQVSRTQALVALLAGMNSQASGHLLDNLTRSSNLVSNLLATGWQPEPVEAEGAIYTLTMLIDYLASIGVRPVREIGSRTQIKLVDLASFDYIGSEFRDPQEPKWVEIRSTGWEYQGHLISKPQVVEIDGAVIAQTDSEGRNHGG